MLSVRLRTASIALLLFLGALFYLPEMAWALFLMPWLLVGAWEWAVLANWSVRGRVIYLVLVSALGVALWMQVVVPARASAAIVLQVIALVFWLVAAPWWLARGWRARHPLPLALTGVILLLPLWLALVQMQAEPGLLLMLMIVLWISDTAAYLCGRQWGRRRLAPSISPGKTWEGAVGAFAAVTLYYLLLPAALTDGHAVLNGAAGLAVFWALTALGMEGDLFESWIKRTAGAKDSGTLLPGHGGILDRIDALTPSIPAAALLLAWFA